MIQSSDRPSGRRARMPIVIAALVLLVGSLASNAVSAAPPETTRIEGVIEAVRAPNAVILRTPTGAVTVDLSRLGGVTVAVEQGQPLAAVGVMEPSGDTLHATSLESPASRSR